MKFSFPLGPFSRYPDVEAVAGLARVAEQAGFWHVSMGEHVIVPGAVRETFGPVWYEPLALAAYLAARTERVRILFGVLVLPYHNPLRLAKAVATVDQISRGRLTVGLGSGWLEDEFRMLNAPFARRGAYTDEAIRLMRTLWTEDPVNFRGEFFTLQDAAALPKPVQEPHPPLWIGSAGRAGLRRAVAFGAGWHPLNRPLATLAAEAATLREMLAAHGRDAAAFTISAS